MSKTGNMALNRAVAELENTVGSVRTGQWAAVSQTGEPYVTVQAIGDETDAVQKWLEAALAYVHGKSGTLYWRTAPELCRHQGRVYGVFARLLVSDKPSGEWLADE